MNLSVRLKSLRPNFIGSFYRLSTAPAEIDAEATETVLIDDSDDARIREEAIEKKRNISRLSEAHYHLVNGRRPYEVPKSVTHLTVKYNRKIYGKYGIASGVNPSLCWPTKQEIQEKLEYEAVAYPFTIQEMMETAAKNRREKHMNMLQRDRDVAAKFAKLGQWIKEVDDKLMKKTAEAQASKEKRERLVEEVRRHFGFKLDPRDERFQEMLVKKEKEQKKKERLAKKEAKEKMMIKLQQKNIEISDSNIVKD